MPITTPCYCTREDVKAALDVKVTARSDDRIDRAVEGAARAVDGQLHRRFWPWTGTRYFDWPNDQLARSWRLWLDQHEVVSVSALVSGGVTIPPTDYLLEPNGSGPPYTRIEINISTASAWSTGATHQRSVAVTGVFGHSADTAPAGQLAEALDAAETAVDVTNSAAAGVGDLILVDSERMLVVDKAMLTTGQTLQAALTASAADATVAVTSGTGYAVGETLLLDSERMLVVDIAGNSLTVKRAWDGTVLAAHTGSTIYAPRTLTVVRSAAGTTAATHLTAAALYRHTPPALIRNLALAEAVNTVLQEAGGYVRTVGSGETARNASGAGLADIRAQAHAQFARKARTRAV